MATGDFSLSTWIDTHNCSIEQLKKAAAKDPSIWKKLPGAKTLDEFNYRYRNITDQQALTWLRKKISSEGDTLKPEQLAKLKTLCKALGKSCQEANVQQKESVNLLTSLWRQVKTEYQIFRSDYALISQQKRTLRDLESFRDIDSNAACQLYWQAMPHLSKHDRMVATAKFVVSGNFDRLLTKRAPLEEAKKEVLTEDEKEALKACAKDLYKSKALATAIGEKYVTPEAKRVIVNAIAEVIKQQNESPKNIWRQAKADLQGKQLVATIHHDLNLSDSTTTMALIAEATAQVAVEKRENQAPTLTEADSKIKEAYTKQIRENLANKTDTSHVRKFYITKKPASEHKYAEAIRNIQEAVAATSIEQPTMNILTLDATQREAIREIVQEMRSRLGENRTYNQNTQYLEQLLEKVESHGRDFQAIFDEIVKTLTEQQQKSDPQLIKTLMQFPKLWLLLQELKSPLLSNMRTPPVSPALHRHLAEKGLHEYRACLENLSWEFNTYTALSSDALTAAYEALIFEDLVKKVQLQYDPKNPEYFVHLNNMFMTAALYIMNTYPQAAEAAFRKPGLQLILPLALPAHYTEFNMNRILDAMPTANLSEKQSRALSNLKDMNAKLYEAIALNNLHGRSIPDKLTVDLLQAFQKYVTKYKIDNAEAKDFLDVMNPPPKELKADKKKAK